MVDEREVRDVMEGEEWDLCQAGLELGDRFGEGRLEHDAIWYQVQEAAESGHIDARYSLRPSARDEVIGRAAGRIKSVIRAGPARVRSMLPPDHPESR